MAMPVSIGDILLLSQIAYRVGLAFTSGRKSAPAEFTEVENQVFALKDALDMLQEEIASPEADNEAVESLGAMISYCRTTLEGLEKIVQEYCPAMGDGRKAGAARAGDGGGEVELQKRKWSKKLKDNWKRVVWTTGDGDLSTLREKLTFHVTVITLVVNTLQSKKSSRLNERFGEMEKTLAGIRLDQQQAVKALMEKLPTSTNPIPEIEKLVLRQTGNIINCTPDGNEIGSIIPSPGSPSGIGSSKKKGYQNKPVFEICRDTEDGGLKVICSRAVVNLEWMPNPQTSVNNRVRAFVCLCADIGSSLVHFEARNDVHGPHANELAQLHLFPRSFATRVCGPRRQWWIYPVTSSRAGGAHQKITIRGVEASRNS
ncbi:hypothetical protein HOY80DRAFT_187517 [Tuber brumale]|nr:hypothetical protein HOY80DRAFT_187517 [Tuber brumale]